MHQPTKTQVSKEGDDDPLSALTAASTDALDGDGDSSSSSANNGGGRRTHHGRGGSKGSGGAWRRYYEGLELIEEIRRDLTRLYPRWVLNRGVRGGGVFGLLVRTHTYPTKFPSPYAARSYSTPSPTPIHPTYPNPLINHHHTHIYPPPKKSGVPEEHFVQPRVQEILLSVLFVWAALHKATAYRQVGGWVACALLDCAESCVGFELDNVMVA